MVTAVKPLKLWHTLSAFYLAAQTDVAAILGLGGSGGTALITPAMQVLPVGIQN